MADEFYREEIIFDVNDDEAIKQVNNAERRIKKAMDKSKKHAEALDKVHASPIIDVRDRMTKQVKKADKLVEELGSKKAAPVITAKDEVSSVIKKTDKLLESLSKNDVEVTARMKGDIVEEMSKAERSLKDIDGRRVKGFASIKGNLLDDLNKAQRMMNRIDDQRVQPRVTLKNQVSTSLSKIKGRLRKVTSKSWKITIGVKDKTFAVFRRIRGSIAGLGRMMTSLPAMLGMGAAVAGPGILVGNAISTAAKYEQSMAKVKAVSGASDNQFKNLNSIAREMGRTTEFTSSQAADALGYLSMAGFKAKESIDALPHTLDLATAGQLDLARSADISSNVLSGFRYDIDQFQRVVDVMAKTQSTANTNVEQLGNALSYVAPAAADAGQSIETTSAAIGLISDAGIQGERAGTALRNIFAQLVDPTSMARKEMDKLGVAVTDSSGELKDLPDIIRAAERAGIKGAEAYKIFGTEAGPAFSQLLAVGSEELTDYIKVMGNSEDAAKDAADIMRNTTSGAIKTLGSAWESLLISIGGKQGLGPAANSFVENLTKQFGRLEEFIIDNQEAIERFASKVSDKLNNGIAKGFNYIRDNYLENDEFKELDMQGKVAFIIGDFTEKLTEWVTSDGAQAVAKAGLDLGTGIITAMAKAMGKAILEDPATALLLGGIILGTTTSIPIVIPLTIALSGAGAKAVKWLMGKSDEYWEENGRDAKVKNWNDTMSGKNTPKRGYGGSDAKIEAAPEKGFFESAWDTVRGGFNSVRQSIRGYATGGFINQEHLAMVGEGGRPEVVIPLGSEKRGRALDLWHKAGEVMGVTPYADGGIANGGVAVQASFTSEKQASGYGVEFSKSVAKGINSNVVSLENWKKNNIRQPMQGVTKEAVGFGQNTVESFAMGQNATRTNTASYLSSHVERPFIQTQEKGTIWGKGTMSEFVSGMKSEGTKVKEASKYLAEQVEKTFKEELGIKSPSRVMMALGKFASLGIVKGLGDVNIKKFAENQAGSLAAAFSGMGSIGGNISEWIKAAMMITGTPGSWLGPLSTIAQKESGGNPLAQNNWDINAQRGIPSKGLMQTIGPTFRAYKGEGMNNILNPIHNAVAAINYIKSRYGSVFNTPGISSMMRGGPYKGYFRGTPGPLSQDQTALVGERGPELVKLPRGSEVLPNHKRQTYSSRMNAPEYQAPKEENNSGGNSGGGVSLNFDLEGLVGNIILQNKDELDDKADEVAAVIATKVKAVIENLS